MELESKVALITGAGAMGGIGAETAQLFAREGAEVVIAARDAERAAAVLQSIEAAGGKARVIYADLTDIDAVRRVADEAGDVDILVNNAAAPIVARLTTDPDVESFDNAFAVNVRAPYFLTAAVAATMAKRGSGSVVNISAMTARIAFPGLSVYGATKATLESLTRSWAAELADVGVRVNAVSAGPTRSDKVLEVLGDGIEQIGQTTLLKRTASTREIAEVVMFLASDRASYITGEILAADGGRVAI
jgi:NAD(P)-dependent dehydrogenase (short-subunit alcohol dehydrogenase family)